MSSGRVHDVAASVRQRLLDHARARGEDFQLLLTRYAVERYLYRLGCSRHSNRFILKGAMLFALWSSDRYRPTRDLGLLATGASGVSRLEAVFRDICRTKVAEDGLRFQADTVRGVEIRENQEYAGVRVTLMARLVQARIQVRIDIGFGDAVTPRPVARELPSILGFPAPRLKTCPRETVVAEKFQAMVMLGIANSRMKDFYDLWFLARTFRFEGATLRKAIRATFARRRTDLPAATPLALTSEFRDDDQKASQWAAFVRKNALGDVAATLAEVAAVIEKFLMPPTLAALHEEEFDDAWQPGGPWRREDAEK